MAEVVVLGVKMVAKYKCPECGKKWKSKNSSGSAKQCLSCLGPYIDPYKIRPFKEKDMKAKRMFGKYYCPCGNDWASGNAWADVWQICLSCDEKVTPTELRPLQRSSNSNASKPHQTSLCQRCIELGYNCRGYMPPPSLDDIDDKSVLSESSTISTLDGDQELSDRDLTPVASDDEEYLDSAMRNLKIK